METNDIMGKYLHLFRNESNFQTAYNGSAYHEPWTSLTDIATPHVDYNRRGIPSIPYIPLSGTQKSIPLTDRHIMDYTYQQLYDIIGGPSQYEFKIAKEYVSSYSLSPDGCYDVLDEGGYYIFVTASSGFENVHFHIELDMDADLDNAVVYQYTYGE